MQSLFQGIFFLVSTHYLYIINAITIDKVWCFILQPSFYYGKWRTLPVATANEANRHQPLFPNKFGSDCTTTKAFKPTPLHPHHQPLRNTNSHFAKSTKTVCLGSLSWSLCWNYKQNTSRTHSTISLHFFSLFPCFFRLYFK